MGDYRLSRTQRNQLFEYAEQLGLDPASSLTWEEKKCAYEMDSRVHSLVHAGLGAYITINHFPGTASRGPGYAFDYWPKTAELSFVKGESWDAIRREIETWLRMVKEEIDAPDLWEMAKQERTWLSAGTDALVENTPFTPGELTQIQQHLKVLEEYAIKTYRLEEEQQAYVRERLDYVAEAAARTGRLDWKNIVTAKLLDLVVTLTLEPQKAHQFFAMATQLLGPFVAGVRHLLT